MTRFFSLFVILLLMPLASLGYLGEHTSLRSQMRVQNSPSIVQMNEAIDTQGVVRQIRWSGPHHPSFEDELGICYQQLATKLKSKARARGPAVLKVSNDYCSLSIGGHLGHVYGEAHLK
jgi:Protein of unknown function (DUF2844)